MKKARRSSSSSIGPSAGPTHRSSRSTSSRRSSPPRSYRLSPRSLRRVARCTSIGGFRLAVFPRRGGRAPELEDPGRSNGWAASSVGYMPAERRAGFARGRRSISKPRERATLVAAWRAVLFRRSRRGVDNAATRARIGGSEPRLRARGGHRRIRLHGDCHSGNVLWTDGGPHFVDLDDCRSGPRLQDLWMLMSGDRETATQQLRDLLRGYEDFRDFDHRELIWWSHCARCACCIIRPGSRGAGTTPRFQRRFPRFARPGFWQDRILELREQIAAMDEPPLEIGD